LVWAAPNELVSEDTMELMLSPDPMPVEVISELVGVVLVVDPDITELIGLFVRVTLLNLSAFSNQT
jgi:hypothetical protein